MRPTSEPPQEDSLVVRKTQRSTHRRRMGLTMGLAARVTAHVTGTRAPRTATAGPVCPGTGSAAQLRTVSQAPTGGGAMTRSPVACAVYAGARVRDARPDVMHAYGCPEGRRCACSAQGGAAEGGGGGAGTAGAGARRARQELPGGDEHVRGPPTRLDRARILFRCCDATCGCWKWRGWFDMHGPQQSTRISCSLAVPRAYNQLEPDRGKPHTLLSLDSNTTSHSNK